MKSTLMLVVASAACLITFLVTRRILREQLKLGPPSLLAAVIAGLAFLGLTTEGEGMGAGLLIPYEALALTLLALFLWFWIGRLIKSRLHRSRTPDAVHQWDSKHSGSRSPKPAPCSQPPKARLPRGYPCGPGAADQGMPASQASARAATRPAESPRGELPRRASPAAGQSPG